jgi:hypothetical protein
VRGSEPLGRFSAVLNTGLAGLKFRHPQSCRPRIGFDLHFSYWLGAGNLLGFFSRRRFKTCWQMKLSKLHRVGDTTTRPYLATWHIRTREWQMTTRREVVLAKNNKRTG